MKITFFGAAQEVTGSCHLVETATTKILVDCGMMQGSRFADERNHEPLPFDAKTIDAVVITHAHVDHVGRLPKLLAAGFQGTIYATFPTRSLIKPILQDAYHVMKETEKRLGHPRLYEEPEIQKVMAATEAVEYHAPLTIGDCTIIFRDAGHILGSSFIEIASDGKCVVFSGDVGNVHAPIVCDTEALPAGLDVLVMESTYGDRVHEGVDERQDILITMIKETIARGGTLLVPAFAIERTQDLLYFLNNLSAAGQIPRIPIYLDSPLAIHATAVYREGVKYYDAEARKIYESGDKDLFDFPGLTKTETTDESKAINDVKGSKVIIAGAGMMNGGRILHHLMRYLPDPLSTVMIVGYQAVGTLGRKLYDGAREVRIYHQTIPVHAKVKAIGAFSAHADQAKLLHWAAAAAPKRVALIHGEPDAQEALQKKLEQDYKIPTIVPARSQSIDV